MVRLLGLTLLMVLAGAVFFRFETVSVRTGVAEWVVYSGQIVDSRIDEVTTLPTVTYVYEVEGATYTGNVVAFDVDLSKMDLQETVDLLDYYEEGTEVEVLVHPERAWLCTLEAADMPLLSARFLALWSLLGFFGGVLAVFPTLPARLFQRKVSWPQTWTSLHGRLTNLEAYGGVRDSLAWRGDGLYETPEDGRISGWSLFVTLGEQPYADFPLLDNPRIAHMPTRRTLVWESYMELEERQVRNFLKGEGRGFRPHVFIRAERGKAFVYGGQVQYLGHELYPNESERIKRQRLHDSAALRLQRVASELEELELDPTVDVDAIELKRVQLHDLKNDLVSKKAQAVGRLRFSFSVRVAPPPRFWKDWGRQGIPEGSEVDRMSEMAPLVEVDDHGADPGQASDEVEAVPIVALEMPATQSAPVVELSIGEPTPQVSVEVYMEPEISLEPAVILEPAVELDVQPSVELEIEGVEDSDEVRKS